MYCCVFLELCCFFRVADEQTEISDGCIDFVFVLQRVRVLSRSLPPKPWHQLFLCVHLSSCTLLGRLLNALSRAPSLSHLNIYFFVCRQMQRVCLRLNIAWLKIVNTSIYILFYFKWMPTHSQRLLHLTCMWQLSDIYCSNEIHTNRW